MKEVWRPVYGYTGIYEVSNLGRVKSLARKVDRGCKGIKHTKDKILSPAKTKTGYVFVDLYKNNVSKMFLVHRLVAKAFIKQCKETVNHIDGDKSNNALCNLEWATYSENNKHAYSTGLKSAKGERNSQAKLTRVKVNKLKRYYEKHKPTYQELGDKFGICRQQASMIIRGKAWVN